MKLWDYLSTHSSQVELVRKDRDSGLALVERVYFRVTPEVPHPLIKACLSYRVC